MSFCHWRRLCGLTRWKREVVLAAMLAQEHPDDLWVVALGVSLGPWGWRCQQWENLQANKEFSQSIGG